MNARSRFRPWLALTQHDYARFLAGSDPMRARELADAAQAAFRELGMAVS